ncbi:membrane protein YfhO [Muriicola jejuensis]|uniref:YfhO family protein n=1 Tax=Muriicola jejuensis TaxID=504488 RepID=A0A6P0UD28_9FLAO|nr:YfhO family protein [Muriicola jejuensis]NER11164.1 YfhO family protein [Muriicola jejuensis]SMP24113.1 membrane protein YfhO [Muriicola jejuensis]
MRGISKAFFTHFFTLTFFVVVALAYFHPVLQGKVILQSDIIQYTGMAKEQNDFRQENEEEPYWTNAAFGGMPTFQLGANYPHNYVKKLDRILRFLPRPADYLFLYFLGFYILLCCMKVDYRLAVLGALAFGFSTYLIIILGVGHNAKAHAIAYLPMVLGGILLTFRGKYFWGFVLTALATALEINANHYQMTYYFLLLVMVLGLVMLVDAIRQRTYLPFLKSIGTLILAALIGVAINTTALLATKEYADWSTRGVSQLTVNPDGSPKEATKGLDREYITEYSYGLSESLNLFVPRLFGGSNNEDLGTGSKAYAFLVEQGVPRTQALEFASGLPLYWGSQPIVAGPAYIGSILVFLFILGLFLVKGRNKWWLLGGVILSLMLSWGKNLGVLTDFMIDYFPLYNKFRAVSSIQVVLELCVPVLGVMGLAALLGTHRTDSEKIRALKLSFFITAGLGVVIFLIKGMFDFNGLNDALYQRYFGDEVLAMIKRDREAVYINDTLRSMVYVILAAGVLWFYVKGKLKKNLFLLFMGVLICFDLVGVALRYVDSDDFVSRRIMNQPFQLTNVDRQIQADTSVYRVYDTGEGLNGARTSYFHKSIGGYHAAKPAVIQDLFDYHIYRNNRQVLNMLNVKYVIQQNEEGQKVASVNPEAFGNAWFVELLLPEESADEEIMALDSLDLKSEAVFNRSDFPLINQFRFTVDSTSSVRLTEYKPNRLTYRTRNDHDGLLVFSELYYPKGWDAYVDGEKTSYFRVNYGLRAIRVPAGQHSIVFAFEPEVIAQGSKISLAASILLGLVLLGGGLFEIFRRRRKNQQE